MVYYNTGIQMYTRQILPALPLLLFILLLVPQTHSEQQKQFEDFAEHLADFTPTESFEVELRAEEQQTFIFWPAPDVKNLRGMFYITSEESRGLFAGFEHQDVLKKTFWDKRIGVFNVPYSGVGDMKVILKSELKNLKIYLSYQFVTQKKSKKSPTTNETESESQLSQLLQKFTLVRNSLASQQQILKSIIKSSVREAEKLREQIEGKTIRVIIETVVLIVSGVVSVAMLKREFRKGYELIV